MKKILPLGFLVFVAGGCAQEDLGKTNVVPNKQAQIDDIQKRADIPEVQRARIIGAINGAVKSDGKGLGNLTNR